jgi:hypothetical protein
MSETKEERTPHTIPAQTDEQLKKFVFDVLAGQVLTIFDVPKDLVPAVFMPIALGAFSGWTEAEAEDIGCIYGHVSEALSTGVNGYPCFMSVHMLNKQDFERCRLALCEEIKRRETLQI